MAQVLGSMASGQPRLVKAIAAIVVAGALGGLSDQTAAQAQGNRAAESIDSLERLFWICDYGAARDAVDFGSGMRCGVAAEALKARKFNGDFDSMLAWWRQKKDVEHGALASARLAGSTERAELGRR